MIGEEGKEPMVSVILLTWNSRDHVKACLDSVLRGAGAGELEVLVVDNGSTDGTLACLESYGGALRIFRNRVNRGVARARNQGLREAAGELLLLLDIDTVVPDSAIDRLKHFMDTHPDVGVCGPKLIYPDGSIQNNCRRFPLITTKLLRGVDTEWARAWLREERYETEHARNLPFDADYLVGACQMIRRAALERVGFLDENIFYGPEDVDFCLRMHLNGWRVVCVPDITVVHDAQRVTRRRRVSRLTSRHLQGLLYFFCKHRYLVSRKGLYERIDAARSAKGMPGPEAAEAHTAEFSRKPLSANPSRHRTR